MSITLGQLAARFQDAAKKMPAAKEKALRSLAQVGVGYMKQEIQNVHAVDTGTMLNSTTVEQLGQDFYIGPTVKYAPYVALGTSRMPGRPFHVRAQKRLQGAVNNGKILKDLGL
jgi:hypothetical protein